MQFVNIALRSSVKCDAKYAFALALKLFMTWRCGATCPELP